MATSDNGSSKNKIWLVVVGIVVLAGVAYVADIDPPADESLTGSIVPAERYRAEKSATSAMLRSSSRSPVTRKSQ